MPQPLLATMDFVQIETLKNPTEDKPVLHFVGNTIKPLVLNVVNRKALIAAYGDETDNWKGKPVEIYVNLDVTNSSGETVGGVRVRVPAATPAPRAPPAPVPAPKPQTPPPTDPHAKTLHGLRASREASNADGWLAWGARRPRTPQQKREQETAHTLALERIALSQGPAAEPELAGANMDADLPF